MDDNIASTRRLVSLRDTQYTLGGIGRTTVYDLVDKKGTSQGQCWSQDVHYRRFNRWLPEPSGRGPRW